MTFDVDVEVLTTLDDVTDVDVDSTLWMTTSGNVGSEGPKLLKCINIVKNLFGTQDLLFSTLTSIYKSY
jgi:hypothetical protein